MSVVRALAEGLASPCEPINSITHLGASVVAALGASPLLALARSRRRTMVLLLYVCSVVACLAISGLFHALARQGEAHDLFRRLDHYAIWLLIAASFTAIHVLACRGFWRWGLLSIVWACGLTGIVLQVLWFDVFSRWPGMGLYLVMGWIGIGSIIKLGRQLGFAAVRPLLHGGLLLTAGALAQPIGLPIVVPGWVGPHELFHVTVIGGILLHWRFMERLLRSMAAPVGETIRPAPAAPAFETIESPSLARVTVQRRL